MTQTTKNRKGGPALRAAIYTRVSADRSGEGRSPEEQYREAKADAERRGWTVVDHYSDNDRGASRFSRKTRPEFARLRDDLAAGRFDVLVSWEASRLTRDVEVYQQLAGELRAASCLYCYSGRVHDLNDPEDEFMGGLDALLSAREVAITRKRTKRALDSNRSEGHGCHGRVQLGYRRVRDAGGRTIGQELDPATAPMMREVFERIAAGETLAGIARALNERGLFAGYAVGREIPWTATRVRMQVLNRPGYLGHRVYKREIVRRDCWPALIDQDTYDQVQAILVARNYGTGHDTAARTLLAGIAVCDECGGRIKYAASRGFYQCQGVPGATRSGCVSRRREYVDPALVDLVTTWLADGNALAAMTGSRAAELEDAARRVAVLRERLAEAEAAFEDGELSAKAYGKLEAKLEPEIAAHEATIAAARQGVPSSVADAAGPDARAKWDAKPLDAQRALLRALFGELRMTKGRLVEGGLAYRWRWEDEVRHLARPLGGEQEAAA